MKHKSRRRKTRKYSKRRKQKGGQQKSKELVLKNNEQEQCGFFATFNKLLTYLVDNKDITKITYDIRSFKEGHAMAYIKEGEELFSKIFEPYNENKPIDEVIDGSYYKHYNLTTVYAHQFYNENRGKLKPYHDAYVKYIKIRPEIQEMINKKKQELRENYEQLIGIFIRSDALKKEQPSGRMPTREEYDTALSKIDKTKSTKYFFCIDNQDDLNYFKNKYLPNYYTDIRRTANTVNSEPHKKTFGSLKDLQDSFIEVALLSECGTLVHCVSNMVTASLYMNMNQKSICLPN